MKEPNLVLCSVKADVRKLIEADKHIIMVTDWSWLVQRLCHIISTAVGLQIDTIPKQLLKDRLSLCQMYE